jgi:hypothetical protein
MPIALLAVAPQQRVLITTDPGAIVATAQLVAVGFTSQAIQ